MRVLPLALAVMVTIGFGFGSRTASAEAGATRDPAAVAQTMREMYAALSADDEAKLKDVITPDFYAFDGGKRFDGVSLFALVNDAHKAGKVFVWTVNEPDVHVNGDEAWIAYVNRGSVGAQPVTWLESAMLRFEGGRWRIAFFHSTRVPAAP